MANVNVRNILVGAGDLYYTDSTMAGGSVDIDAEQVPAGTDLRGYLDDEEDWKYAGATQDGLELTYTPDYGEVEVDQMKGAAKMFNQNLTVTLGTNLAEAGLERLLLAWGVDDDDFQSGETETFRINIPEDDPVERSVAVVGKGTPVEVGGDWTARERLYLARRVISVEGSTVALRRTEATTFPVSFRLLPDPAFTREEGQFGKIVDRLVGEDAGGT